MGGRQIRAIARWLFVCNRIERLGEGLQATLNAGAAHPCGAPVAWISTNRKYDFRGSRLTDVLGRLLYEDRLGEGDLRGLREEKMKSIRSFARFLRDGAA
jgi:hypothetical protein